jgi:nucleotide-binding universal stress UspA family protein
MKEFSVKFRTDSLDLNAAVSPNRRHGQFKIELLGQETEPIILTQLVNGDWEITDRGTNNLSDQELRKLGHVIDLKIKEIYQIKNILVTTDFSDASINAARYAAALSHQLRINSLVLYHSYAALEIPSTPYAPVPWQYEEQPEESLEKAKNIQKDLDALISTHTRIETYNDERALIAAVNEMSAKLNIGLVITSTTGKSNLERILVGSNTLKMAKHCKTPLLMVPSQITFKPIKQIVFACDLKDVSESTPIYAIKTFVHAIGAKLLILNVDQDETHFNPDRIKEMTALHQLWDREEPEYHYIDDENIAHGIVMFAEKYQADLIVTVPKVYGFFESIFHSSITKKLAYTTHLPLLLFKDEE